MNNPGIDPALFGEPLYAVAEVSEGGKPCLPIPCPSGPPATAEDMRTAILAAFEALWDEDHCRCYRCLKAAITETL